LAVLVVSTYLKTLNPAVCAYMRQQWPIGRWPWYLDAVQPAAARENRQGAPAYRGKNRRNPPKIRDPRSAATGLPSGGKGHVSLKYLYKK